MKNFMDAMVSVLNDAPQNPMMFEMIGKIVSDPISGSDLKKIFSNIENYTR